MQAVENNRLHRLAQGHDLQACYSDGQDELEGMKADLQIMLPRLLLSRRCIYVDEELEK